MRLIFVCAGLALTGGVPAGEIDTLRSVGNDAQNAEEARAAYTAMVEQGSENLVPLLRAMRGATPLAANWLGNAFESIAQRESQAARRLPKDELVEFIRSTSESPAARRLAYEWLRKDYPDLEQTLIPNMLLDPGSEFRRDAVAMLIDQANRATGDAAIAIYSKALTGAVHNDQVKFLVGKLRESGREVDLQRHFGFLTRWQVIGPFDNRNKKGFAIAYPPESSIDLETEYDGQLGRVGWQLIETDDDYGIVDIGKQIENYKGSLMYLTTSIVSEDDQTVELRLGTPNAWKLWVNGDLLFEREEYHRSSRMDQYKLTVNINKGKNVVLLKLCQNEQTEDWAQVYRFQLRVCDIAGAAVRVSEPADDDSISSRQDGGVQR